MFFYFIKYPVVIYMIVDYFYLHFPPNIFMIILSVISIILIVKDFLYPIPKDNCTGVKK